MCSGCCFIFLFFVLFVFLWGFKGQVRWPFGPPHLALNPPYDYYFVFFFWGGGSFCFLLLIRQKLFPPQKKRHFLIVIDCLLSVYLALSSAFFQHPCWFSFFRFYFLLSFVFLLSFFTFLCFSVFPFFPCCFPLFVLVFFIFWSFFLVCWNNPNITSKTIEDKTR